LKAVVLAAGFGTRLKPLTDNCPKPLIPLLNNPILHISLDQLFRAGFRDFGVNAHYLADFIEASCHQWVEHHAPASLKISKEINILGTGGALVALRSFLGGDTFLVYNGDIVSDIDFLRLQSLHEEQRNFVTMTLNPRHNGKDRAVWCQPPSNKSSDFSDDLLEVVGISKDRPDSNPEAEPFTFASGYCADRRLIDFLPQIGPSDVIAGINEGLTRGLKVVGMVHKGFWADIGSPKSYFDTSMSIASDVQVDPNQIQRIFGKKPVLRHDTAQINPSARLLGSVIVGARAVVKEHVTLQDCILLDDSIIESGEQLRDSIASKDGVRITLPTQESPGHLP
jgi:mannose-1-phosphate guanylyltransferase